MAVTKYWDGAQWVPILAGPTGPQGPQGPEGPQGPQGTLPADVVTYTGTVSKMHGPITQAAYDALSPPDADTWYIIVG